MTVHAPAAPRPAGALPPGPRLPVAAQAVLWMTRGTAFMERCARRYGTPFTVRLPMVGHMVNITDPEDIRRVFMARGDALRAGEANSILEPLLGASSVLLLDGAEHMRQRRLMLPSFHGERMQGYGELMTAITAAEVATWPVGVPFPLAPAMQRITLDVILRAVFGIDDADRLDEMRRRMRHVIEVGRRPITLLPLLRRNLPVGPWRRFVQRRAAVDELLFAEIARRRNDPRLAERDDILSLLLQARDDQGNALSDVELRDELVTLLAAGHETTATALAWFFHTVLRLPAVLQRLEAELETGETRYLDAAIREQLRLRPVVPLVVRMLHEPFEVGGYTLPPGATVAPNIVLTHRRADIYPEPMRFKPERFLDGRTETYEWLPFGGGVRRCLGASFATFEMRQVVSAVLSHVRLRAVGAGEERAVRHAVTLVPARGARVVVEARRG